MMFKLGRVMIPENLQVKDYSNVLKAIEKKPDLIIRHCTERDNK